MSGAVLSVCIPTYNRLNYVSAVIDALGSLRRRLAIEIVVSDDASVDATPQYLDVLASRDPSVRVIHQPRRLGGFANTAFVLQAARGRFAVYHADDDRVDDDALLETVDWLEAHADYAAVYAPVDTYDLATNRSIGPGPHTTDIVDFDHHRRAELISYIALGLTPEHAVYRSECLRNVIYDTRIYWSLSFLDSALQAGKVRFAPKPFYRAIQSHWPGERREQLYSTVVEDLITWETFRAGLELILARQPGIDGQPERREKARTDLDASIRARQSTALDFLLANGRWVEFLNSYRIVALRQGRERPFAGADLRHVTDRAIVAVLMAQSAISGRPRIVLVGLTTTEHGLIDLFRAAGAGDVREAPEPAATDPTGDACLFLARDGDMARELIARGAPAFAVFDCAALYQHYTVSEPA